MDSLVVAFIQQNVITIGLILALLKGIAKITPWSEDDQVVETLTGAFKAITGRGNGKPKPE